MKNKEDEFSTLHLSPESCELYLQAGLLARSVLAPSHPTQSETVAKITKTYCSIYYNYHQELTATGIAPDLHRIPF